MGDQLETEQPLLHGTRCDGVPALRRVPGTSSYVNQSTKRGGLLCWTFSGPYVEAVDGCGNCAVVSIGLCRACNGYDMRGRSVGIAADAIPCST